jgi:hypothetical protein
MKIDMNIDMGIDMGMDTDTDTDKETNETDSAIPVLPKTPFQRFIYQIYNISKKFKLVSDIQ